jgi:hypothetical protein
MLQAVIYPLAPRLDVVIDIAIGVRPATRLERVIADMQLQFAKVIIHRALLIPAADDRGLACEPIGRSRRTRTAARVLVVTFQAVLGGVPGLAWLN